jgi:photosystem II stability/assembly factor-like uncharacterized protein
MKLPLLVAALLLTLTAAGPAQDAGKAPTPANSWIDTVTWRSIGPANMGGRITALAVYEKDPSLWWAATASGGLLKTTDNGITFEHQFDREKTVSIGDVAVAQSHPDIVWVGTGEANPRNSVSWGNGVYRSVDGGKTWTHMGLEKSFQIGAVCIHPTNSDIVYVAALGRLWGPSEERGLYKTLDAGKTWTRILFVDDKTGVVDVQMHPKDPETLLVATYERRRDGFDVNDPARRWGPGSGLHKTTDGGKTFHKITKGLPTCAIGRIGVEYSRNSPDTVYMVLETERIGMEPPDAPYMGIMGEDADVGARLTRIVEKGPSAKAGLKKDDIVLAMGNDKVHSYADLIRVARHHVAEETVTLEIVRERKTLHVDLTLGKRSRSRGRGQTRTMFTGALGGQRANLQDQQGKNGHEHGGLYRSTDGGDSFTRVNSLNPRPMYFSEVRADPNDEKRIYVLGINMWKTDDGGARFTPDAARGPHVDHHALWIDPSDSRHMILGNDGGIYVSYDRGAHWDHLNHAAIGQFYHVGVGTRRGYKVYGGLQDNGSWGGPSIVRGGRGPTNADWIRVGGGDGFVCRTDPDDPDLVYFSSQYGNLGRYHLRTGDRGSLRPRAPRGTRYRFNWNTPYVLSHHNGRILYSAGNHVFRSLDRGNRLRKVSPEITLTKRGSATALAESPVDPDVLYVGTDDGALWISRDGAHTWADLFAPMPVTEKPAADAKPKKAATAPKPGVPTGRPLAELVPDRRWVAWIEPSRYAAGRAYLVLDGHRSDDDRPHVFATEDFGVTWRSIVADLPDDAGTTRVLAEDIVNENVLYLGTEFGAQVSIDRGTSWTSLNTNLPTVAVHAIAQHPTAGEIVAATHGRSLWVLDVTTLRQLKPDALKATAHLFGPRPAIQWRPQPTRGRSRTFTGQNPPTGAVIDYRLSARTDPVSLKITTLDGKLVRELDAKGEPGMHRVVWDLRWMRQPKSRSRYGPRARAGTYRITLQAGKTALTRDMTLVIDPDHPDERWITGADLLDELESEALKNKTRRRSPWLERGAD